LYLTLPPEPPLVVDDRTRYYELLVHQSLQSRPISTLASLVKETQLTMPTVTKAVQALQNSGIVTEITGRRRGRIYSYREYMNIMDEGMAPQ